MGVRDSIFQLHAMLQEVILDAILAVGFIHVWDNQCVLWGRTTPCGLRVGHLSCAVLGSIVCGTTGECGSGGNVAFTSSKRRL